jgi:hypothetical protein
MPGIANLNGLMFDRFWIILYGRIDIQSNEVTSRFHDRSKDTL